jgi:hypothetical protein
MCEVVSIKEARIMSLYRCRICGGRADKLFSVRLSEWIEIAPPDYETWLRDKHRYELRTEFICGVCLSRMTIPRGTITGFLTHVDVTWRLSLAKEPIEYDYPKWLRYMRRYRPAALAGWPTAAVPA